ncbi:MAG: DNA repair protein RecO [Clostridia bacterium]|nr:DNA repair protein RecO [Clostridia bacterium]
MSSEKIRGIIIRENFSGEADKFLTLFAKDKGKISIFAKGARNTKSKFLAASSLFTYGDFIVRTSTKTPALLSADVIESFYNIRTDLSAATYASYFAEFIDKAVIDNVADNNAMLLLLKSLQKLSKKNNNTRLTGLIFQLRFLDILGYKPDIKGIKPYSLSRTSLYATEYILNADLNTAFSVSLDIEYIKELEAFIEKYIEYHIDIKLNSYKLIKNLVLTN